MEGKGVVMHSILPKAKDWDQDRIDLTNPLQKSIENAQIQLLKNQLDNSVEPDLKREQQLTK